MKDVDFAATRERCTDRCINVAKLARKHGINKNTLTRYLSGKLDGTPGQGVYGRIETALEAEGLLVFYSPPAGKKLTKFKIINTLSSQ
jgi:transcriptional regulator with XRE-family HTH domain